MSGNEPQGEEMTPDEFERRLTAGESVKLSRHRPRSEIRETTRILGVTGAHIAGANGAGPGQAGQSRVVHGDRRLLSTNG